MSKPVFFTVLSCSASGEMSAKQTAGKVMPRISRGTALPAELSEPLLHRKQLRQGIEDCILTTSLLRRHTATMFLRRVAPALAKRAVMRPAATANFTRSFAVSTRKCTTPITADERRRGQH